MYEMTSRNAIRTEPMSQARVTNDPIYPNTAPSASYETALAELETLLAQMENGHLSLEESLAAYRRGAALIAYCRAQLERAEQQVRVLDGESLQPFPSDEDNRPADG
jgi:exodeoxyribonuclease VII small subunit